MKSYSSSLLCRHFMTDLVSPAPETVSRNDASVMKPIAPGFRFHPTDEELITYYLKRKIQGKPVHFDAIGEVNVYKHEPSDLPELSRLKTKDQEWFFFCALEKKQNSSTVVNRATKTGYWKKTGVDKEIKRWDGMLIGVVKTLVFYSGRSPKGDRTNWIVHEYHLLVNKLEIDSYVLCRVLLKGPHSGCIYAPFSEQDWDDCGDDGGINEKIQQVCVNQEAPFPLTQYKRKRQTDNNSFGSYFDEDEREPPVAARVPTSSELINHLENVKQQMAMERGAYQLSMMSKEIMVSFLQGQVDALCAENEKLKKTNNTNKG